MNTLNFNDADLKANREGRLSDAQMKRFDKEIDRLQKESRYSFRSGIIVFFMAALVMMIFAYIANGILTTVYKDTTTLRLGEVSSTIGLFNAIVLLIFFIFAVVFVISMVGYGLKIWGTANAPVRAVEGKVEVIYQTAVSIEGREPHQLIVHRSRSMTFELDGTESLHPFNSKSFYHVYYLPGLKPYLLSAEEVEMKIEKAKR